VRNDLGMPMLSDMAAMESQAREACGSTPAEAGKADAGRSDGCFALSYQAELLRALGAPTAKGVSVSIANSVGGGDVDWALGAALLHIMELQNRVQAAPGVELNIVGAGIALSAFIASIIMARAALCPQVKNGKLRKRTRSPEATKIGAFGAAE